MAARIKRSLAVLALIVVSVALAQGMPAWALDFSFAVIADPHIDGKPDHLACLQKAVGNVIATRADHKTVLVFVLGDIAWGGVGAANLATARAALQPLNEAGVPYVPLIGDNDCQTTVLDRQFHQAFSPQYAYLSERLTHWNKSPTPVEDPRGPKERPIYLQNFSFDWGPCHFVCADFATRPGSNRGTLHDFPGGTWPWMKDDLRTCAKPKEANIVIFSHIPLFHVGLGYLDQYLMDGADDRTLIDFLFPNRAHLSAVYAGHIHQNFACDVQREGVRVYTLLATDETWSSRQPTEFLGEPGCTVRYVGVTAGPSAVRYTQTVVEVP